MKLSETMIEIFYKTATSSSKIRNLLTPIGLVFFFAFAVLFIVISLQLDNFLKLPKLFPTSLHIILAAPVLAVGLFLILWSIFHFIKIKGTPVPFNPPQELVTTGPYVYVRNPMLTGVFIFLFGLGALFRSISLVSIFTPIFILLNVIELKKIEEPEMEKRLGEKYKKYKKNVPMFIPFLKLINKK